MNAVTIVRCQIIGTSEGYQGVITDARTGETLFDSGFQGCPEDCDGLMEAAILRHGWRAVPSAPARSRR
jgi:hypothetical protein